MKKYILIIALFANSLWGFAQINTVGVHFEPDLDWNQALLKAQKEGKYVFVDCYATWCGPCKLMDREVFNLDSVGQFMNNNFVSLKIQMDSSSSDDEKVKHRYMMSKVIQRAYLVDAFPTFLFFSPDGKLVHRYIGGILPHSFLYVAHNAITPGKQYYLLKEEFLKGNIAQDKLRYLAVAAQSVNEKLFSESVVRKYLDEYLNKQSSLALDKRNLEFIYSFKNILTSNDKIVDVVFNNASLVDSLLEKKGAAQSIINQIINREFIKPFLWPDGNATKKKPTWDALSEAITNKYNIDYAERNILNAKIKWYEEKKEWPLLIEYFIAKNKKYGIDTEGLGGAVFNNQIWEIIFLHSTNSEEIKQGIVWTEMILSVNKEATDIMDTKANLLYKAGEKKRAILIEKQAFALAKKQGDTKKMDIYKKTIDKIKLGIPTWH